MSDLYGPPLSFRAIDKTDGSVIADKCSLSAAGWWTLDKRCEIVQSTGLHDAAGVEVYGGDVIISKSLRWWIVYWDGSEYRIADSFNKDDKTVFDGRLGLWRQPIEIGPHDFVIGNRWQPREALEARARDVLDGCLSCSASPMSDNCKASACDAELERFGL